MCSFDFDLLFLDIMGSGINLENSEGYSLPIHKHHSMHFVCRCCCSEGDTQEL